MNRIKKAIFNRILMYLMDEWVLRAPKIKEGDARTALIDFIDNENLQMYLDIVIANLIRRHLYVKDLEEKSFLSGGVFWLRTLQKRGRLMRQGEKRNDIRASISTDSDVHLDDNLTE